VNGALLMFCAWRLLQSANMTVHYETGVPQSDAERAAVLLRQALIDARDSLPAPAPRTNTIHIYAATTRYCAATRAPWWQAAVTLADGMYLQPPAVLAERGILRAVLRHEAIHILARARQGRPLARWHEEGLAAVFAGEPLVRSRRDALPSLATVEDALAHPRARDEARRAYRSAAGFIAYLRHASLDPAELKDAPGEYARFVRQMRRK
jgi:hypothetical protein